MKKKSNEFNLEEFLRFDNEMKKMKLVMEYGADFIEPDPLIPPEVENIWLERILQFEEAFARKEIVTVYEKIGMPDYREADQISDKEIHYELLQLIYLLHKNQMVIDTDHEVSDRDMYRFITEEIFDNLIYTFPLPGVIHHFIYNE